MIRLGWTLLHFLWQGTLIAAILAAVRAVWGRQSLRARARYSLACAALSLMAAAPVVTYFTLSQPRAAGPGTGWTVPAEDLSRVLPAISIAWFAGVVFFSLRLAIGWRVTSRLRRASVRPAPPEWEQALEQLMRRMRVARPVKLLISALAETPMVIGWLRPVVPMPVGALTGLPAEHAWALLAHELAHVLRNDYLANLLQGVAEVLLFYHPAVWWVSAQIREEREQCCDELAVEVCGGNALLYARALAEIEACRPARLKTAMAAGGGSLLLRIRRLIGQTPSMAQMVPGPSAAVAFVLLLVAGISAAGVRAPKPPALHAKLAQPVVDALLYDPMFAPPHAAAQVRPAAPPEQAPEAAPAASIPDKQHGHLLSFQVGFVDPAYVDLEPLSLPAIDILRAGGEKAAMLRSRLPNSVAAFNTSDGLLKSNLPLTGVAIETWLEDSYASFAETFSSPRPEIEAQDGKATVYRVARDWRRKLIVDYDAVIEILPQGAYRISFSEAGANRTPLPDGFTHVALVFPVPQIAQDGETTRLELYREPESGLKFVDCIHVGALEEVVPRAEAPHDSSTADAEFPLSGAQIEWNGVRQAAGPIPQTLRGPVAWIYLPGYGRYSLSYKPPAGSADPTVGEVNGNVLTFSEGRNILRLECAERIASGSGSYRVYVARDEAWMPASPNDQGLAQIGAAFGR